LLEKLTTADMDLSVDHSRHERWLKYRVSNSQNFVSGYFTAFIANAKDSNYKKVLKYEGLSFFLFLV
jgi:hypothetical protein